MTDLSVFRRRRMYGRTSARSGAYELCGCRRETCVTAENAFPDPNRPGLRKSKMDQRSPRRFSTGVPLSAMRARASICLAARVCLVPGVLDRLGLVQDGEPPGRGEQRGHSQQRSIAGDHEIGLADPVAIERLQFRAGHRRGMRDDRDKGRREALDLRGPIGQQGCRRNQEAGPPRLIISWARASRRRAARVTRPSQDQQQRQYLHRLAEAHIIGEAGAQTEAG